MYPDQEVTNLRRAGRLDEAYQRGRELRNEYPEDPYLANSFGWVLYDKVKKLVEEAKQSQEAGGIVDTAPLRNLLREYARLRLPRPDLLFSLLLSQTLRFPKELDFLPAFMKWAGLDSFQTEDYQKTSRQNRVFEPLVERVARKVGKVAQDLNDAPLKEFAVELIDKALVEADVQQAHWLHYRKALLLNGLGRLEEAKKLLIPFVQENRNQYWAWQALADVVEDADPVLALALCAKACLTCNDPNFGVSTFEACGKLAAQQGKTALARWAANQAFTVRSNNRWKIPQSLRDLLNANWYSQAENLTDAEEVLANIAADAEQVIWANCPRYDANYLGTFTSQSGRRMVKFGLFSDSSSEEMSSPARGLLNNLNLVLGDPVTVTVDESGDRPTIVVVEKRHSGTLFDRLERVYGVVDYHRERNAFIYLNPQKHCKVSYTQFPAIENVAPGTAIEIGCARHRDRLNPYQFFPSAFLENENIALRIGVLRLHQNGFGFVDDAFVSPNLACQLQDGQEVNLVVVKKFNQRRNQMGWTAIAILD